MNLKYITILLLSFILLSCDDGDIIITSFDFSEADLQFCQGNDEYVFFSINPDINEVISFKISQDESIFLSETTTTYAISASTNIVDYRIFDETVTSSYFCNSIPPTSPNITTTYSSTGGEANIITIPVFDDEDGIPTLIEDATLLIDTDGDGLLDYYDDDDDGDNVPTALEGVILADNGEIDTVLSRDTDGDGVLDYLDNDDDGDGVLTINEDLDSDLDPTNDVTDTISGIANYLNDSVVTTTIVETYREHDYSLTSSIQLSISNLVLVGEGEEITQESLDLGQLEDLFTATITITPDFVVDP